MGPLGRWFVAQSARGQFFFGCLGIVLVASFCLYGVGLISFVVRPLLTTGAASSAPTIIARPTQPVTPTAIPEATMALPGSTLVATPTQAPLPTRAPTNTFTPSPSITDTVEITGTPGTPAEVTPQVVATDTPPPPPPTATNTRVPPTATKIAPSKTPTRPPASPTPAKKPTKTPKSGATPRLPLDVVRYN